MEKITKSISKNFPPVKLYLDDLIQIIEILESNDFNNIEILTASHKFSKEELPLITYPISEIKSHGPFYISIRFNDNFGEGIRIYSGSDSTLAEGIIQKLGKIFLPRKRTSILLFSNIWVALTIQFLLFISASFLYFGKKIDQQFYFSICIGGLLLSLFFGALDSGKLVKKNIFNYYKKVDQPSFWIRKKDEILVGIIVAIITILLTIIITKLLK
jgi:hypothetical protein